LRWHFRIRYFDEHLRSTLENPDAFFSRCVRLFKGPERSSTVGSGHGLVLKRVNFRKPGNLCKDLFRRSRAIRAYRKAHHLELLGIASPRPVAAAERRWLGFLRNSYLVVEEVTGARDLGECLAEAKRVSPELLRRVADLVARLHQEGFSHRDLKETNLLVDSSGRPHLIDLDGLVFLMFTPEERAARDLARLGRAAAKYPSVTLPDRVVFLRRYCKARGLGHVPRS
jgi:tRNA A-37 threonylcarbamoyl transferase component Bud32